jgi:hypothetical protein
LKVHVCFLFSHVRVYVGNVFVSIDVNIFEEEKNCNNEIQIFRY